MAIFLGRWSEYLYFIFYSKSPLLDVAGFAKQGTCIKNIRLTSSLKDYKMKELLTAIYELVPT
jgi:hypothetical protein